MPGRAIEKETFKFPEEFRGFLKEIILPKCEKEPHRQKEPFRPWDGRSNNIEMLKMPDLFKEQQIGTAGG